MKQNKPKTLIYDIETSLMLAAVFNTGDQVIRHHQLIPGFDVNRIICITYTWLDNPKTYILTWDKNHDDKKLIEDFDKIIKSADVIIGKNNKKFDDKHVNFHRLLNDLPPMPDWAFKSDDLEVQLRRYFNAPSQSLDYWSKKFGLGGKNKMEFDDWYHILLAELPWLHKEYKDRAAKAEKKMGTYGKKDAADTKFLIKKVAPHVNFKFNMNAWKGQVCCKLCGSTKLVKDGSSYSGKTKYEKFACRENPQDHSYAGKRPWGSKPNVKLS